MAGGRCHRGRCAHGDIALSGGKIVFDRLRAELDRMRSEGHLDYAAGR